MAKKNYKKDYSATKPVADNSIPVVTEKPVNIPVIKPEETKAEAVTMPKVVLSKKVKVKFLKPGMCFGYGVFAGEITDMPLAEFEKLEKAGVVLKIA